MPLQSEEAPEMPGLKFLPCQRRWNSRGLQVVTVSQRWQLKGHWELQFHLLILAFLKVSLRQDKYFLKTCLCYLLRRNHTVYTTATSKEKSIAQQCRFQTLWSQHGPAGAALALLALLKSEHWFVSVLAQGWHCPVTSPTLCWNLALWQGVESASYPAESELLLTKHPWGQAALTPHPTDCSAGGFISWGTCQRHGQPCRMAPALCAHRTQVPSLLLWNKTRHGRGKHELITGSHKFRYCRYMRYL